MTDWVWQFSKVLLVAAALGLLTLNVQATQVTDPPAPDGRQLPGCEIDADGWTVITPAAYSRTIFVSNTSGSDINTGLSEQQPVRSLRKAFTLVRAGTPDHVLLKRGDAWYESLTVKKQSGRDEYQPLVISAYGDQPDRPIVGGIYLSSRHVAVMDLQVQGPGKDAEPDNAGVEIQGGSTNILLENVVIRGCKIGVDVRDAQGVSLRRCVIVDQSKLGMFIENTDDLLVEQCLLDNNGRDKVLEHNIYKSRGGKGLVFRDNIVTRGANCGIKMRARSENVEIVGNVFSFNATDVSMKLDLDDLKMGRTDWNMRNVTIRGNIFLNTGRGKYQMPITAANTHGLRIESNYLANSHVAPWTAAISIHHHADGAKTAITDLLILDNVITNVASEGIRIAVQIDGEARVANNIIQVPHNDQHPTECIKVGGIAPGDVAFDGNTYYNAYPKNKWFAVDDQKMSFKQWQTLSHDRQSTVRQVRFVDPGRSLAGYHQAQGGSGGFDGFIIKARCQDRHNWDGRYTAEPLAAYIIEGLTKKK